MGIFLLKYKKWLLLLLIAAASAGGYSAFASFRTTENAASPDANMQMKRLLESHEAATATAGAKTAGTPSPKKDPTQTDKGAAADFAEPANAPTEELAVARSTAAPNRPKAAPAPTAKTEKSQSNRSPQPSAKPAARTSARINLNTAGLETLMDLPGIGDSKAKAIVAYREQNGSFRSVEELLKVKGIGPKLLESIRGLLTV